MHVAYILPTIMLHAVHFSYKTKTVQLDSWTQLKGPSSHLNKMCSPVWALHVTCPNEIAGYLPAPGPWLACMPMGRYPMSII